MPGPLDLSDCRDGKRIHEGTYWGAAAKKRTAAIEPEKKTVNSSEAMLAPKDERSLAKRKNQRKNRSPDFGDRAMQRILGDCLDNNGSFRDTVPCSCTLSATSRRGKVCSGNSATSLAHPSTSEVESATFFDRYTGPVPRHGFQAAFTQTRKPMRLAANSRDEPCHRRTGCARARTILRENRGARATIAGRAPINDHDDAG